MYVYSSILYRLVKRETNLPIHETLYLRERLCPSLTTLFRSSLSTLASSVSSLYFPRLPASSRLIGKTRCDRFSHSLCRAFSGRIGKSWIHWTKRPGSFAVYWLFPRRAFDLCSNFIQWWRQSFSRCTRLFSSIEEAIDCVYVVTVVFAIFIKYFYYFFLFIQSNFIILKLQICFDFFFLNWIIYWR